MPELSCLLCHRDFKKHSQLIKHQTRDKPTCFMIDDDYAAYTELQRLELENGLKRRLKCRNERRFLKIGGKHKVNEEAGKLARN